MRTSPNIRTADPKEAGILTELALRSKAHWGYSSEFIEACRAELAVTPERLTSTDFHYQVAERDSELLGFYAIGPCAVSSYELEALFVEPVHIGRGVGQALIDHAKHKVKQLGGMKLSIQGDPNAEKFYLAAGGKLVGQKASGSIPGRKLPLFEIELMDADVS